MLDTTVFVDYWRRSPVARSILDKFLQNRSITAGYSIITEAELWVGALNAQKERETKVMLRPFDRFPLTVLIAHRAGSLKAQFKSSGISLTDSLIAATAIYFNLAIISRNTNHYAPLKSLVSVIEYTFN